MLLSFATPVLATYFPFSSVLGGKYSGSCEDELLWKGICEREHVRMLRLIQTQINNCLPCMYQSVAGVSVRVAYVYAWCQRLKPIVQSSTSDDQ